MTILDNIRGKAAQPMQAPEVARKLRGAEAELAQLEATHGSAALDAIAGEAGAQDRYDALKRNIAKAREHVATLQAAHTAAIGRDEEAMRAKREAVRKTQLAAARKHLEARDAAAAALSAAIAEAAEQYHVLLDRSAKAQAACPIGDTWPDASLCEPDPLRRLVENELFRLSATAGNRDNRALPGAVATGTDVIWQPDAIPPLAERIKKASAYTVAALTGKE